MNFQNILAIISINYINTIISNIKCCYLYINSENIFLTKFDKIDR